MNANVDLVYQKIKALSPQRLAEVADFVDFLQVREEKLRAGAGDRLGEAMSKLDAANVPPMSAEQIQAEIKAARAERR